jgi:hypothetical protein
MDALDEVNSKWVISQGLWPPQSLDLNLWDIYLWATLKEKLYVNYLLSSEEFQENIRHEISVLPYNSSDVGTEHFSQCKACLEDGCQVEILL